MYTPQNRPGLKVELLLEDRLVLVSTDPAGQPEPGPGYIYIDWGPEFFARHGASFPNFVGPALTANIGWLGLQHILENGGAGYFPVRLLHPHLRDGRLTSMRGAPEFSLPAYVVYPAEGRPDHLEVAIDCIRRVAAAETPQSDLNRHTGGALCQGNLLDTRRSIDAADRETKMAGPTAPGVRRVQPN